MAARSARKLVAAVVAIVLGGCSGERTLPNGYKWISIYGDSGVIVDGQSRVVVDLKVSSTALNVSDESVYGVREIEEPIGNPPSRVSPVEGRYGHFVLNTKTGAVGFPSTASRSDVR